MKFIKIIFLFVLFAGPLSVLDFSFNQGIVTMSIDVFASAQETINLDAACGGGFAWLRLSGCWTPTVIYLGGIIIALGAAVFDFFLGFTLNPNFFNATYIQNAWATMRDLANLTFIFGIIAVAFTMIIPQLAGVLPSWKTLMTRLIIVALLLNFSLFFTRVVIDAGNILGNFFYTQLTDGAPTNSVLNNRTDSEIPSPAAKITNKVDLLRVLDIEAINTAGGLNNPNPHSFWFVFNIIYLMVSVMLAWSFFKVGFMMLSRTVWLVILSIISPLAFVLWFIPSAEGLAKKWFIKLLNTSFCIVVYLFFIFLLLIMLDSIQSGGIGGSSDDWWIQTLINVAIQIMLVFVILNLANKRAQEMCEGAGGGFASKAVSFATGAAGLVAGGPLKGIARGIVGGKAYKIATEGKRTAEWATSQSPTKRLLGQALYSGATKVSNSKFGLQKGYKDQLQARKKDRINYANTLINSRSGEFKQEATSAFVREKLIPIEREKLSKGFDNLVNNKMTESSLSREDAQVVVHEQINTQASQNVNEKIKKQDEDYKNIAATIPPSVIEKAVSARSRKEHKDFLKLSTSFDGKRSGVLAWMIDGGSAAKEAYDAAKIIDGQEERKQDSKRSQIADQRRSGMEIQRVKNKIDETTLNLNDLVSAANGITNLNIAEGGDLDAYRKLLQENLTYSRRTKDGNIEELLDTETYTAFTGDIDEAINLQKEKVQAVKTKIESLKDNTEEQTKALAELQKIEEKGKKSIDKMLDNTNKIIKKGLDAKLQAERALGIATATLVDSEAAQASKDATDKATAYGDYTKRGEG